MSDLSKTIVAIMTRHMVTQQFDNIDVAASIGATTHTGSVYLLDLEPGEARLHVCMGEEYVLRRGTVSINGEMYEDVYVGFDFGTGTFLVLDTDLEFIRRSSSLATIELLG